jgi:hypothetical protein
VSRALWAHAKFGLIGAGVVLAAACNTLLVTWWRAPLDRIPSPGGARFGYLLFDLEGLVPVGYVLFAVALGTFAGALTRKSQAAMAITLVGFLATRLLIEFMARPRFLAPVERRFPVEGTTMPNDLVGDWIVRGGIYAADGTRLSGGEFASFSRNVCPPPTTPAGGPPTTADPCLAQFGTGAYNLELIHPVDRFWLFQGIETAVFVALSVALLLAAIHWVRRRIA